MGWINTPSPKALRRPFDGAMCDLVVQARPPVVSFHFGLPPEQLLERVKSAGCVVMASATTVAEARWLEAHGADVVIAQGSEAGGHRGTFLNGQVGQQPGMLALVPQVVDAVRVPVVAAGGIADGLGIAAAFALGATGVQIGTAYLKCPESQIGLRFRQRLEEAADDSTVITNVMTGRAARGLVNRVIGEVGPIAADAPPYPLAAMALAPLRTAAERDGCVAFTPMWAGQAVALARSLPAADLTRSLSDQALKRLRQMVV